VFLVLNIFYLTISMLWLEFGYSLEPRVMVDARVGRRAMARARVRVFGNNNNDNVFTQFY